MSSMRTDRSQMTVRIDDVDACGLPSLNRSAAPIARRLDARVMGEIDPLAAALAGRALDQYTHFHAD